MCSRSLWQALVESGLPPALLGQLYTGGGDKRGHPQGCVGGAPRLAGLQAFWRASSMVSEDESG